jgi:hypothetical protein
VEEAYRGGRAVPLELISRLEIKDKDLGKLPGK